MPREVIFVFFSYVLYNIKKNLELKVVLLMEHELPEDGEMYVEQQK